MKAEMTNVKGLRVASTMTLAWGALMLVSAIVIAAPLMSGGAPAPRPELAFCAGLLMFAAAFLYFARRLRTGSRAAAITVIALFIVSSMLSLTYRFAVAPLGGILGILVVGTLLNNWDKLSR